MKDKLNIIYYIVGTLGTIFSVSSALQKPEWNTRKFFICASLTIVALIFVYVFLNYYEDNNKYEQEIHHDTSNTPNTDLNSYYTNEVAYLSMLNDEIQTQSLTDEEREQKLHELNVRFNILVQKVNDCENALKVYYFEKQHMEQYYTPNEKIKEDMKKNAYSYEKKVSSHWVYFSYIESGLILPIKSRQNM